VSIVDSVSDPFFVNCSFLRNTALVQGGAVDAFAGTPFFNNCVFSGNIVKGATDGEGGAIYANTEVRLVNSTLSSNEADCGGAVFVANPAQPAARVCINNCILWNNSGDQISGPGPALVNYSVIQGSLFPGDGNLNADPEFEDELGPDGLAGTGDEDLRLSLSSPANDAGNSARVALDSADLDGDGDTLERSDGEPADPDAVIHTLDGNDVIDARRADPERDTGTIVVPLGVATGGSLKTHRLTAGQVGTANNARVRKETVDGAYITAAVRRRKHRGQRPAENGHKTRRITDIRVRFRDPGIAAFDRQVQEVEPERSGSRIAHARYGRLVLTLRNLDEIGIAAVSRFINRCLKIGEGRVPAVP